MLQLLITTHKTTVAQDRSPSSRVIRSMKLFFFLDMSFVLFLFFP